ncbi:MAG TPA: pyridoxal-phosphate dependent enzyme [Geobacterales bacterium]|nr:pyridoxal-phosphate dependent enzyme [Geobacterales bacterium]
MFLKCLECKFETSDLDIKKCPNCNGFLVLKYDNLEFTRDPKEIGIWKYNAVLPKLTNKISLGEGNTPIIKATQISKELGIDLYFKNEGTNPTGSFMDRGSAVYISFLKDCGKKAIKCFTTGNFGCSIAAYCSKANIEANIYVHERVNHFKLLQMIWFGSRISMKYDEVLLKAKDFITPADPMFLEGLKTQFLEIFDYFEGDLPDYIALPMGSGSNIFSNYKAFRELKEIGLVNKDIKFIGAKPDEEASRAFADLDPSFLYCKGLIEEIGKSGLLLEATAGKEEMVKAMDEFAKKEGILVEPITSISLPVIKKLIANKKIKEGSKILIILTGSGLKEIGSVSLIKNKGFKKLKIGQEIGFTKRMILEVLSTNSLSGYELWKKLREKGIEIRLPTLYEHLKQLEEMNFITSIPQTVKNRKVNIRCLTKQGSEYLRTLKTLEH